jgi:hypothetical protein
VLVPAGETAFLGILRETGAAIGRVEVFDLTGNEGISSISLYADAAAPCPWDTAGAGGPPDGAVGINDFLDLLAHWGPCPPCPGQCPWDTSGPGGSPDGAAGINDFLELLAHWGACPG